MEQPLIENEGSSSMHQHGACQHTHSYHHSHAIAYTGSEQSRLTHNSSSMRTQGAHGLIKQGHIRTARRENTKVSSYRTDSQIHRFPSSSITDASSMIVWLDHNPWSNLAKRAHRFVNSQGTRSPIHPPWPQTISYIRQFPSSSAAYPSSMIVWLNHHDPWSNLTERAHRFVNSQWTRSPIHPP